MAVAASQLRGGVDYPRTRLELDEFFPDDAACLEYVEGLRWPEGFVCVGCGGLGGVWRASRGRLVCPHCRRQTSVLAGTVFHRTRSPLRLWFLAAWELTSQKYGANALGLPARARTGKLQDSVGLAPQAPPGPWSDRIATS